MRKVLVTGGCGFAGHHLVEHLLKTTDDKIVVVDSLSYVGRVQRVTDIESFDPHRVEIVWHDLRAPLPRMRELEGITDVVHLAAKSHVDRSIGDPVPFVTNNVAATLTMLEWARERHLNHFVQISTDEVYGPAAWGQAHKEWEPHIPSNPYSASKSAQEAIAISYWRTYGVPVVITNTMNLYGERQHPEKFVPMTLAKILLSKRVTLHGRQHEGGWDPSTRHWLHARNHADAICWVLRRQVSLYTDGADRPDRWHISGQEMSVEEMAVLIAAYAGRELRYGWEDYHTSRPGHDHRYALDSSKIREAGWMEPMSTADALGHTIHWMVNHPEWLYQS